MRMGSLSLVVASMFFAFAATWWDSVSIRAAVTELTVAELRDIKGGAPTLPPTCFDDSFYSCPPCNTQIKCNAYNNGNCYDEAGSWFCPVTTAAAVNVYNYFKIANTGWYELQSNNPNPVPCELVMDCECVPDPNNPANPPACSVVNFSNDCGNIPADKLQVPVGDVCP